MDRVLFVRNEDRVPDIKKLETMFGVKWLPLGDEVTKKKFILKEQRAKKKSSSAKGCIGILETQWPNGNPTKGGPSKYYSLWRVTPHDKADAIRAYLSDPDTYIDGTRPEIPPDGRKIAFLYLHDRNRPTKEKKAPVPATSESFADAPAPAPVPSPTSGDDLKDSCVNALNTWKATDEQRERDHETRKNELKELRDYITGIPDNEKAFSKPWLVPYNDKTKAPTNKGEKNEDVWKYRLKQEYAYNSANARFRIVNHDQNGGLNSGFEHLTYDVIVAGVSCDTSSGYFSNAELTLDANKEAMVDILNLYLTIYNKTKFEKIGKYTGLESSAFFKPFTKDDITLFNRTLAERDCGTDRRIHVMQAAKTNTRIELEKTWKKDIENEIAKPYTPPTLTMACNDCRQIMNNAQTAGVSTDNAYQQTLQCIANMPRTTTTTNNNASVNQDPNGANPREVDDDDDDKIDILGQKIDTSTAFFGGALSSLSSCCLCIVLIVIFFVMRN